MDQPLCLWRSSGCDSQHFSLKQSGVITPFPEQHQTTFSKTSNDFRKKEIPSSGVDLKGMAGLFLEEEMEGGWINMCPHMLGCAGVKPVWALSVSLHHVSKRSPGPRIPGLFIRNCSFVPGSQISEENCDLFQINWSFIVSSLTQTEFTILALLQSLAHVQHSPNQWVQLILLVTNLVIGYYKSRRRKARQSRIIRGLNSAFWKILWLLCCTAPRTHKTLRNPV